MQHPDMCKELLCLLLKQLVWLGNTDMLDAILKAGCVQRMTTWIVSPAAKTNIKSLLQVCNTLSSFVLIMFQQHHSKPNELQQEQFCSRIMQEGLVEAITCAMPKILGGSLKILINCISALEAVFRCSSDNCNAYGLCVIKPTVDIMLGFPDFTIGSKLGRVQLFACNLLQRIIFEPGRANASSLFYEYESCSGIKAAV
jgi:hypothetical protein